MQGGRKMNKRKAAVFILLGQSNAVGHAIPMAEEDIISTPLKNVYGLCREKNQSFENDRLYWDNYVSAGMNLGEAQDNTYSVANCLASIWQKHIDEGNERGLGELYIVQIAIGAQGVTEGYMWNPRYPHKLIPGKLGTVDISLLEFSEHILSLLERSFSEMGKEYEIMGLHWRGGENDTSADTDGLFGVLESTYKEIFDRLLAAALCPPTYLHRLVMRDRTFDLDPTGEKYLKMGLINAAFERLCEDYENINMFDIRKSPLYLKDERGYGLFIKDMVHYKPEVNIYVAQKIFDDYIACGLQK